MIEPIYTRYLQTALYAVSEASMFWRGAPAPAGQHSIPGCGVGSQDGTQWAGALPTVSSRLGGRGFLLWRVRGKEVLATHIQFSAAASPTLELVHLLRIERYD